MSGVGGAGSQEGGWRSNGQSPCVVEIVAGRIVRNRAEERTEQREARVQLWTWLAEHSVVRAELALNGWVAKVQAAGVIDESVERTRTMLATALNILAALPTDGRPLPVFAQRMCGDTKALDDDKRLAMLVLRALAVLHDLPEPGMPSSAAACGRWRASPVMTCRRSS